MFKTNLSSHSPASKSSTFHCSLDKPKFSPRRACSCGLGFSPTVPQVWGSVLPGLECPHRQCPAYSCPLSSSPSEGTSQGLPGGTLSHGHIVHPPFLMAAWGFGPLIFLLWTVTSVGRAICFVPHLLQFLVQQMNKSKYKLDWVHPRVTWE